MKKKVAAASRKIRIAATTIAATGLAIGAYFLISAGKGKPFAVPAYEVKRVIDGDTFETKEGQRIRIASAEAPEMDACGGPEAKQALEKLILDKPVYLKVTFRDRYQRLVSLVYADGVFVNEEMLGRGFSYYQRGTTSGFAERFSKAGETARQKQLGLFGESCTQTENKANPSCNIKGNIRDDKIYYLPDCGVYPNVSVQLYLGDRWFCSEKQAIASGFRRPSQCKD